MVECRVREGMRLLREEGLRLEARRHLLDRLECLARRRHPGLQVHRVVQACQVRRAPQEQQERQDQWVRQAPPGLVVFQAQSGCHRKERRVLFHQAGLVAMVRAEHVHRWRVRTVQVVREAAHQVCLLLAAVEDFPACLAVHLFHHRPHGFPANLAQGVERGARTTPRTTMTMTVTSVILAAGKAVNAPRRSLRHHRWLAFVSRTATTKW